ncbi:type II toxin-antitoxin system VapC family toxin [Candidatus Micrarchaeota archaeon]|nr:type II toxin-antitoxin system VapC family toxin [Candidatus Micrarchaeota archaeon]
MNYVDANVIIYALTDRETKGRKSRELLANQRLCTSILSLDEVAYKLSKRSKKDAIAAVDILSHSPTLLLVPFLPQDVDQFKSLLEGFDPRDAIHALTATKMRASIIYSEDPDFDQLAIARKTPW